MIRKFVDSDPRNWDQLLPKLPAVRIPRGTTRVNWILAVRVTLRVESKRPIGCHERDVVKLCVRTKNCGFPCDKDQGSASFYDRSSQR